MKMPGIRRKPAKHSLAIIKLLCYLLAVIFWIDQFLCGQNR
jgi:hypothetical protein